MKDTIYLVVKSRGVDRMLKTRLPSLRGGELAIKLTVTVDDANFRSPLATASLDVPDSFVIEPDIEVDLEQPETEEEEAF